MTTKLSANDAFPATKLTDIHDIALAIPDSQVKWTHLQFRRFAGCPICNLHLQSFVRRNSELVAAGVREIVVFHSSREALLPFQGAFPFHVIGDPGKKLYRQFGVETSLKALLNPAVWPVMFKGSLAKNKPKGAPEGGPLGLPADFLISSDGRVIESHYGKHAYDQWSVDQLLELVRGVRASQPRSA